MNQSKKYNVSELNHKIGTRRHLYDILSQHYFLPSHTSHACTLKYLMQYTEEPIPIYSCILKGTGVFKPRFRNHTAEELLEELEELLKRKGLPSTGMSSLELPDVNWLSTILHKEDPNDTLKMFTKKEIHIEGPKTLNSQ